jgi:hypothetical protein
MNLGDLPNSLGRFKPKKGWGHMKIGAEIGSISKL